VRLYLLQDRRHYALGSLSQACGSCCLIGDNNAKEQRMLILPIHRDAVHDSDYVRSQGPFRFADADAYLVLIDQSSGNNRHVSLSLGEGNSVVLPFHGSQI
jgi:hypothetical protein